MKEYIVKFVTKKGGEEKHEVITIANNAKEAVSNVKEIWYSENTMHAFRMHAVLSSVETRLYYFTNDYGEEVFNCVSTLDGAYNIAEKLANKYKYDIILSYIVFGKEEFFDYVSYKPEVSSPVEETENPDYVLETSSADEPETEEATPEVTAPVETEHSDYVPETVSASYPLDVPFDMRIKHLCRICKHLNKCFDKERSEVLEYYVYNHEYCGDLCGDCTLCCSKFESIHIETIQVPESDDDDLPF